MTENEQVDTGMKHKSWTCYRWHLWLLMIGLLIRIGFCLMTDKEASFGGWDGKEYYAYAQSLLAFRGDDYPRFFNCIRAPLYPIFLTPFVALSNNHVWHIQLGQALLGVLQAVVLAKIAGRWRGQHAGNWAFVLALFNPFLIFYTAFIWTETLFIFLLWTGVACLQRWNEAPQKTHLHWLTSGAVTLALACLTRPALQPFLVVAVFWIGWRVWHMSTLSMSARGMAYFTLIVSAILLPWMSYNLWAHEEFSLAPGSAQLVYTQANSPDYLRTYEAQTKEEYYQYNNRLHEHFSAKSGTQPSVWAREANDFRQNHAAEWRRLQWYKFKHFWTPWLNPLIFPRQIYWLSILTITPLFLLAAAEVWRRRSARDPFLLLLLGLVATGYLVGGFLFHVQVRYRIPFVDVSFLIITSSFLAHVMSRKWVAACSVNTFLSVFKQRELQVK